MQLSMRKNPAEQSKHLRAALAVSAPVRWLAFLLALFAWCCAAQVSAQTQVSGTISADAHWSVASSPYLINGNVVVANDAQLTIDPGVTIYMGANAGLTVQAGAIYALGKPDNLIRVLSDKTRLVQNSAPGDWKQWIFSAGSSNTRLEYVWFEHGRGLAVNGAAPTFNNLILRNHQGAAISQDLAASPTGTGIQASGNTINGVLVPAGEILGSAKWALQGIPYVLASGTVSVGAAPTLRSLTPNTLQQGLSTTVDVAGTRLTGLGAVSFDRSGIQAQVLPGGTDSHASLTISVDAGVAPGNVTLAVLTDAGQASAALLLTRRQPQLLSINPASVTTNTQVSIALTGTGFLPTSNVFYGETALLTTFVSDTALSINASFANAAVTPLSVRTPDPDNAGNTFVSNGVALTTRVSTTKPDLTVSNVVVGSISVNPDGSYRIPVSYRITNIGDVAAAGAWYAGAYLSADGVLSDNDVDLYGIYDRAGVTLAAGASVDVTTVFVTRRATGSGNYTLFIKADAQGQTTYYGGATSEGISCSNGACLLSNSGNGFGTATSAGRLTEENEANNATGVPLTLTSKPDLTVSNVVVGAISVNPDGSYRIPVSYRITNVGSLDATGGWYAGAYLSTDGVLSDNDVDLYGIYDRAGATLAAGASVDVTTVFVTRRATGSGNYTLFIKADAQGQTTYYGGATSEGISCSNGACLLSNSGGGFGAATSAGRLAEENESNNASSVTITLPTK